MGNKKKNEKKKHTTAKNIMISIGCAMFAGIYVTVLCLGVQMIIQRDGQKIIPAWLDRVEIHVDGQTALSNNTENEVETGTVTEDRQRAKSEDSDTTKQKSDEDSIKDDFREERSTEKSSEEKEPTKEASEKEKSKEEAKKEDSKEEESKEEETKEESKKEDTTQTQEDPESEEMTETEESTQIDEETESVEETENTDETRRPDIYIERVETVKDTEDTTIVPNVTSIVKSVMPCIVSIRNEFTAYDYWYDEMYDDEASASGIIIDQMEEELIIVTNYHVIEDYNSLYVTFIDAVEVEAYVKGASVEDDLAVLSIFIEEIPDRTLDEIAIAVLGDSDTLEVGEAAITIGNALGYGQSVTTGIVSAFTSDSFAEDYFDGEHGYLIQTDAAINPGNSGGALLNAKGEVVGICEGKLADYGIEGMGYAIPISSAKPIIEELMEMETRKKVPAKEKGFLGIAGEAVSEEAMEKYDMPEGVYVSKVLKDTAAEKAGILKGDIVLSIDGMKVVHMTEVQNLLEYYTAGTKVEVVVMRQIDGEYDKMVFEVELGNKEN